MDKKIPTYTSRSSHTPRTGTTDFPTTREAASTASTARSRAQAAPRDAGARQVPRVQRPGRPVHFTRVKAQEAEGQRLAKRQSQSLNAGTQVDELSHRMGALRFAAALPSNFPSLVGAAPRPPTASERQAIKEMLADGFMSIPIFSTEASGLGAGKFVGSIYVKGAIDEDADPKSDDEWTLERDTLSVSTRPSTSASVKNTCAW